MKNSFSNKSDQELVDIVREGASQSSRAFESLYDRYSDRIFTYCSKVFVGHPDVAQDIFQDTFEKFYEVIKKDRLEITNLSAYLIKVARNLCLNEKHKKSSNEISIEGMEFEFVDRNNDNKELNEIIHLGIESLQDEFKEVLVMKEFMDMSYKDIAEALEIDMSIVRVRIFRAKQKLKKILEPYLNDFYFTDNKVIG